MGQMGMRWTKTPKDQYVDGHERPDVVDYRQNTYIPRRFGSQFLSCTWTKETISDCAIPSSPHRHTVYWHHDETTFTQNDRHQVRWVPKDEKPVPPAVVTNIYTKPMASVSLGDTKPVASLRQKA